MAEILKELHNILEVVGPPLISLAAVWLGWRLGLHFQRWERRLESLNDQFAALREIMDEKRCRESFDNMSAGLPHESVEKLAGPEFFEEKGCRHDLRAVLPNFMKFGKRVAVLHGRRARIRCRNGMRPNEIGAGLNIGVSR